jgi:hypothetical protein
MLQWEYKSLTYGVEGKVVYSLRFWEDSSRRAYVLEFAEAVWPLAREDPDPVRWADAFAEAAYGQTQAGQAGHRLVGGF